MEYIPGNDKWLDPPDEPTHWKCDSCKEMFDGGDLNKRGDYWYCDECANEMDAEAARNAENE